VTPPKEKPPQRDEDLRIRKFEDLKKKPNFTNLKTSVAGKCVITHITSLSHFVGFCCTKMR
jgi:hypothetical protein